MSTDNTPVTVEPGQIWRDNDQRTMPANVHNDEPPFGA